MDLFDGFDAPPSVLAAAPAPAAAAAAAAAAPDSVPSSATGATRKRQRHADGGAAESSSISAAAAGHAAGGPSTSGAATKASGAAPKHHDLLDTIAETGVEPGAHGRGDAVIEYDAAPPEDDGGGAADSAAVPTAAGGAGGSAAGDVLVARPTFGVVDESRTTAVGEWVPPTADWAPAKAYPFKLDPFQQRAVECLERNESVLVSAHTSAGKTVVAEYAIAMSLRDKQRVIYTSPIKALSNQKYRDLFEEFSDVGLMTGDVTINPNASCLVMTTEILRSMLYRGSEVMREVKWVVFDEIHYMRDKERGVVWEESIVMLPHSVRFVFLSATIPNAKEFALWVAKIHHQTCHVVYTEYRPTPLQHFIFPAGGEGVFLVVDEKGRFREDNFNKAMAALGSSALDDAVDAVAERGAGKKKNMRKAGGGGKGGPSDLFRIVKMCMERKYDPLIVFSFAKRECEQYALQLAKLDFTTPDEKALIGQVFSNAIDSLSDDDKQLPQLAAILPLLRRGIGIHHGGLLPILKEVIEILFQESLVKVLFATETFSMGLNMPARTVVFTASRKWDGTDFRWISPGEYIQMSGRAGRRGLDDRGIVIQMVDEKMEPDAAKNILRGTADALNSAFHLGYNMLLNLSRVEDADPERMMALSFHQFQSEAAIPALAAELETVAADEAAVVVADEPAVAEYYALCAAVREVRDAMRAVVTLPEHCLPFLQPGRLVRVVDGDDDWGWGVVVNFNKRAGVPAGGALGAGADAAAAAPAARGAAAAGGAATGGAPSRRDGVYVVDVLLACDAAGGVGDAAGGDAGRRPPKPRPAALSAAAGGAAAAAAAELRVVPTLLPTLAGLSSVRVYLPKDLRPSEARSAMAERLREVLRRFPAGVPLLDPVEDMQIGGAEFGGLVTRSLALQTRLAASPVQGAPDRDARFDAYKRKLELGERARTLRDRIASCQTLAQRDTLKKMKRVLRRLGHLSADGVVQVKGRVACEVNTADELLVTELIFNGVFNELDSAQAAALLSCLVYTEKGDDEGPALREELAAPLRALQDAARRIAQVSADCKIEMDAEEYVASFRSDLMELVHAWVHGAKFIDICGMTKEFEGTIVRVLRRLEELCRQLADAAKAVGDEALERKFKEASAKMRRGVVFSSSLYL